MLGGFFIPQKFRGRRSLTGLLPLFYIDSRALSRESAIYPSTIIQCISRTHQPIRPTLRSRGGPPNHDATGRIVDRVPLIQGTGRTQERKLRQPSGVILPSFQLFTRTESWKINGRPAGAAGYFPCPGDPGHEISKRRTKLCPNKTKAALREGLKKR